MLRWLMPLMLAFPLVCSAVDKEIVELQRDIALVDDRVRTIQRSMDQKMDAMMEMLESTQDRVDEVQAANGLIDKSLKERLSAPVAGMNVKLDRMSSNVLALKETITDLNARLGRLEQQLVDMQNAMRTIQAPPPPPSVSEALGGPPAGVNAQSLYRSALRDKLAGNHDLALQEFSDYLRYFGDTELASGAQFHIGEIQYNDGDLDAALNTFNTVLEQYPKSGKAPDALYLKARTLAKQGKRSSATAQLKKLVRTYPNSDAANRAKADLKRTSRSRSSKKR